MPVVVAALVLGPIIGIMSGVLFFPGPEPVQQSAPHATVTLEEPEILSFESFILPATKGLAKNGFVCKAISDYERGIGFLSCLSKAGRTFGSLFMLVDNRWVLVSDDFSELPKPKTEL